MSEEWIIATVREMANNKNKEINNTGEILQDILEFNPEIIYTKLIRTNKDGTIVTTDNPGGWEQ